MEQQINALVLFERGSNGFTEQFDENKSIQHWIEYFTDQTIRNNNCKFPEVFYLQKTVHNDDGTYKVDEFKNRIYETIYLNEKVISVLRNN